MTHKLISVFISIIFFLTGVIADLIGNEIQYLDIYFSNEEYFPINKLPLIMIKDS